MTEKEIINMPVPERELTRCSWCGETDNLKKLSACPGDDLENPRLYHEKCFEALQISWIMAVSDPSISSEEELKKKANAFVGIKKKKK
jgi:hypothetical protein